MLPFNKPYISGKEIVYVQEAIKTGMISGNGIFTKKCQQFFEERYKFEKCILTTSCTSALKMISLLIKIKPGDEVIVPSYTFVATANAFLIHNAKIVFADSTFENPNIDPNQIERLITEKTKAIVVVHYAGVACEMDKILQIAKKNNLYVIEDSAHAIDSFYKERPLGSIGHFGALSFHETKNIISGEGGMLIINDKSYIERAKIISEKGTNRTAFFNKEIDKYSWVDVGSSFLPSDMIAGFLYAQLENLRMIQDRRVMLWNAYYEGLTSLSKEDNIYIPQVPEYATNNAHLFYFLCKTIEERKDLISYLKSHNIQATFHYQTLHGSDFYTSRFGITKLPNAERFANLIVRLPLFYELEISQVEYVVEVIKKFYNTD